MYKIIFVGTPDFAAPALRALVRDIDFKVGLVVTQPDQPAGRGMELKEPHIKQLAKELHLEIIQPEKIKDAYERLAQEEPDFIIVAAYAQLIPENILKLPKFGCINIHGSLLPKYRGAGVVQAPLLNGDKTTGVTIMLMDKGLDTGDIVAQQEIIIEEYETAGSLMHKLSELGGKMLLPTLKAIAKEQVAPEKQDNSLATYVGLVKKEDGLIDWNKDAQTIERQIRAMSPWPGAWTWLQGQQLKLISAKCCLEFNMYKPGKIFVYNNHLAIQCGKDSLILDRVKLAGRNEMSGEAFINGRKDVIGIILG